MTREEEQAYNDGRCSFGAGRGYDSCRRRAGKLRAAWHQGYEHERGIRAGLAATAEQVAECERVKAKLADWGREFFGPKFDIVNGRKAG